MAEVVLARAGVTLRPLRRADEQEWLQLRRDNRAWLRPWEATTPPGRRDESVSFAAYARRERRSWRTRSAYPTVVVVGGRIVGRVSIAGVQWGAECGGSIGYWIDQSHAGKGITPTAVALLAEHGFAQGLHRLEIAMRPENDASVRVAVKLGFREEALRKSYLFIDGDWRDHRVFALTADEPRVGPFWAGGS
jgi:ribosomal-protein-alanine N-acetyltransferase